MKKYSYKLSSLREEDSKVEKVINEDALVTSEDFNGYWRKHINDLALFKNVKNNGRTLKKMRSTDYASIGIMDKNDLYAEAYLSFLDAYSKIDWKKINNLPVEDRDKAVWAFVKKTTMLNMNRSIRNKKDGMRITNHGLFDSKEAQGVNVKAITSLFHVLDKMWIQNVDDVSVSKYETDLLGYFLEVHMNEFLDLTFKGERNLKGTERLVIKAIYGIDEEIKTYKELSEILRVSPSTLRKVKERAVKKLQGVESLEKIANFCREYRITTGSWAREWDNTEDFLIKLEESSHKEKETVHVLNEAQCNSIVAKQLYKDSMWVLRESEKYNFSEGEDLTDEDLAVISKRTKKVRVVTSGMGSLGDIDLENVFQTYNNKANLSSRAFGDEHVDTFKIGNNINGGI